jgi:cytochrome oxidase Cu insertion factor (SCO1/SenC/PrrC family)
MTKVLISVLLAAGVAFCLSAPAAEPKSPATAKRASPVKTGEAAPGFTLTDQNGGSHSLSAERGKRAVVLVFYRGYW